jgi:hypothetical protein
MDDAFMISAVLVFCHHATFFGLNDYFVQTRELTGWDLVLYGWIGFGITAAMVWTFNYDTSTHHQPIQRVTLHIAFRIRPCDSTSTHFSLYRNQLQSLKSIKKTSMIACFT